MRKLTSLLITIVMLLSVFPSAIFANESVTNSEDSNLIFRVENKQIQGNNFTNLTEHLDQLKVLNEGTIIIRFRHTGSGVMTLFSLSNNTLPNGHFQVYITPSVVGSENRYEGPGKPASNTHVKADVAVKAGEVHTVAIVVDQDQGYKYFLDGNLIKHDTTTERKFLSNIYSPNTVELGRTDRREGSNEYLFSGAIDFAEVYGVPLADEDLIAITGVTQPVPILNPMPEEAKVTEPYSVFYSGYMNSNNYRIPSLFYTDEGTLIAGIDRRVPNGSDSPNNIDAVIRRSFDQGDTWETNGIVINDYPDQASNIDQALLQDSETGRIFSLVNGFPHSGGMLGGFGNNAYRGTGFKTIDGKKYMYVTDASGNEYTIREEGKVYNNAGGVTNYTVDEKRNLFQNGVKVGNIFGANSPLKAYKTQYLELYYSDDEGATWTGPIDLNDQVKEDWMIFNGPGPGVGIQLKEGPHEGRLVFPVYFLNEHKLQSSAVIYSDDHGQTWHRSESPNEGRDVGGGVTIRERYFDNWDYELTEAQVVELPGGQLKMFMRNYSGYARIATSLDGGETWEPVVETESALVAAYCQMTAIRYNGQIDGKEAVIFASPANPSSRVNGTVLIGLITENGTYPNGETKYSFDWKYSQVIKESHYAYSSLTNLPNGEIGLFYEGTDNTTMSFIKFNVDFIKWQREAEKEEPKLTSISLESADGYESNDTIRIKTVFDKYVMLNGNRNLKGMIGDQQVNFELISQNETGTEFIFEGTFPDLAPGKYSLTAQFADNLSIYNVYGLTLPTNVNENKLTADVTSGAVQELEAATYLSGPNQVRAGESFTVKLGVRDVAQQLFAEDISIQYDDEIMEFESAISLTEGVQLLDSNEETPGYVRFILASKGAQHGVSGDVLLLDLKFKAKTAVQPSIGNIAVEAATLGLETGDEIEAATSSIQIRVVQAGIPADTNNDGKVSIGDLALVAKHYGKDKDSPDWAQISHLDVNGDESIDVKDLAFIAQALLE